MTAKCSVVTPSLSENALGSETMATPAPHNNNNSIPYTTLSTTSSSSSKNSGSNRVGPRAKCDQVVYEAIAKAAEIIVRSRCSHLPPSSSSATTSTTAGGYHFSSSSRGSNQHLRSNYGGNGGGASSSRFNLEVEEVEEVRAILQRWRRSLHVPLRLDVYYQNNNENASYSDNGPTDKQGDENSNKPILLERWCIDYTASDETAPPNPYTSNDDTIVQLRQVCKRVVVLLRSLHCLTRMMPAFRLHRRLMETNVSSSTYGGYYAADGSNQMVYNNNMMSSGGIINFSFYVSGHDDKDTLPVSSFASLASEGNDIPFAKHVMSAVPTPYGKLHVTGLYDATLDAEKLLQYYEHSAYPIPTKGIPIPIQQHGETTSQQTCTMDHHQEGPSSSNAQQYSHQHQHGANMLIPPLRPSSLPAGMAINIHSHHAKTPPHNSPHSPIVSPCIIQNYTDKASPHNSPHLQRRILRKAQSNVSERELTRQESFEQRHLGQIEDENGGATAGMNSNGNKRVLSGLSLALMNEDMKSKNDDATANTAASPLDNQQHQQRHVDATSSPHSTGGRKGSIDEATVLRHRLALHHPPPLTHHQHNQQQASSSSPKRYMNENNGGNYHSGEYGYGYNNGYVHYNHNQGASECNTNTVAGYSNDAMTSGAGVGLLGTSPSPMVNTPPQPMFLATGDNNCDGNGDMSDTGTAPVLPPFRSNPLTLQPYPPSHEHNRSISMLKAVAQDGSSGFSKGANQQNEESEDAAPSLLLPPVTSLDLLQKSPFKNPNQMGENGSLLSSLSLGGAAASTAYSAGALGADETNAGGSAFGAGGTTVPGSELLLRNSSALGSLHGVNGSVVFDNYNKIAEHSTSFEDMPFAVDMSPSSSGGFLSGGTTANSGGRPNEMGNESTTFVGGIGVGASTSSSLAVTSLAHRCATAGRLKLFSNDAQKGSGDNSLNRGYTQTDKNVIDGSEFAMTTSVSQSLHGYNDENNRASVVSSNSGQRHQPRHHVVAAKKSDVSLLAEQLAEFRSFGASLSIGGTNSATSFATTSSAAPIGDVKSGSSAVEAGA